VDINLFGPEVQADPTAAFAAIRAEGPVVWNDLLGMWMTGRHAPILQALRDPGRFSSKANRDIGRVAEAFVTDSMGSADPPDHARLRRPVRSAFTPRAVAALEAHVAELVDEMLEPLERGQEFDVLNGLAEPLPGVVITAMMGVPGSDREMFTGWADDLVAGNSPLATPELGERAVAAGQNLRNYFADLIAQRRESPADDLVTRLIEANSDGALNESELLSSCVLLLFGGLETTRNLIGNSLLALFDDPEQRKRLVGDPALMPTAVEELLRFVGPAQGMLRAVVEDTELDGQRLAADDRLLLMIGCGNRDERAFDNPDRLDLGRDPNPHLAFAFGVHFCLGAAVARLEVRHALAGVLRRAPEYRVTTDEVRWRGGFFIRGLEELSIIAD
jgi:pimeloyl-[acyl-carrier protein] synthase